MDFRPAWDVDRLILGKIIFVSSILLYLYFLDFLLYEYSSFSSSRNSFYILGFGRTIHEIQLISVLFGDQKT